VNHSDKKSVEPREVELKLQLPPGSRAILEAYGAFAAAKAARLHQVTTYFDTPDRVLDRAGLTLRVRRIAAELSGLAPLWISPESKSARGWHLRTGETAGTQQESPSRLRRRTRAAAGFHEIIGGTLGHLMANIVPALRGDTEGVHQMRKALRASRAALKLFEPHLEAPVKQKSVADTLTGFQWRNCTPCANRSKSCVAT
jgi:inorganic triphosphatase YgiF